jgi:hypothetical protein
MAKLTYARVLDRLDDLEISSIEACGRGIELSRITAKLKDLIDITPLLGRFQQLGFIKIVYKPSVDKEPLIQLTQQGKRELFRCLEAVAPSKRRQMR